MDLQVFTQMLNDKRVLNFNRLKFKFGNQNFSDYFKTLSESFYHKTILLDFKGNPVVLLPVKINVTTQLTKSLFNAYSNEKYSKSAMEDEIISTLLIEQIDTSRESVRNILNGVAPTTSNENKAYGIKRALDFIADNSNKITESNIYKLYKLAVGDFLEDENQISLWNKYRNDVVFVVGQEIEHQGLDYKLLPMYVDNLIKYIDTDDELDEIVKSVIVHYYFAYLHPYAAKPSESNKRYV